MANFGRLALVALAIVSAAAIDSVRAHHSYVSKYDAKRLVKVSGVVANVRYANPHIYFDVVVATKSGTEATWTIETEGILAARGKGLTEALLKEGARATVTGWAGRGGSAEMGLKSITIGGRTIAMRNTAR
ncbi:MAG: hypothetical protein KDJ37_11930 [Hyphomicrobiaceae bacterium]|nr:hypothetical protein [Hyphomicrobiaceae bacterium]